MSLVLKMVSARFLYENPYYNELSVAARAHALTHVKRTHDKIFNKNKYLHNTTSRGPWRLRRMLGRASPAAANSAKPIDLAQHQALRTVICFYY
jgi:hypothetical protein